MDGTVVHRKLRFGPFELSIGERVLRRDGRVLPLGDRALDIVSYLADRPSEVIAKRELMDHVENDYVTGYSTNSSTLASSVGGMVRSSALAVLRLMISSNAVACRTGRSAGFVPFRIWPARCDRRRRGWRRRRRTRGKPLTRR
jgi:hypothetical protein